MYKAFIFPASLILAAAAGLLITVNAGKHSTNTFVQIQAAPSGAKITVDGANEGSSSSKVELNAGQHSVTVSRSGFASQTRSVAAVPGQTVYAGFILEPDSSSTQNWYNRHSSDQTLSQSIIDQAAQYATTTQSQTNPFLQLLPLSYGDGVGQITISQGVPVAGSNQPAIYVDSSSATERQGVLQYIRSRGYNPAKMDIVFFGVSQQLDQESGEGHT